MITPVKADLTKVQSNQIGFVGANPSGGTCTLSSVTQGDIILLVVGELVPTLQAPISISDSVNTYTNIITKTQTGASFSAAIYAYSAIATQSVSLSIVTTLAAGVGTNGAAFAGCAEFNGNVASFLPNNTFTNSGTINSGSSNPISLNLGSSFTPTQNELIFSMIVSSFCNSLGTETPPYGELNGFNFATSTACNGSNNIGGYWRWSINPLTLASPTNAQWTYNWNTAWISNSANWVEITIDYIPKTLTITTTFTTTVSTGTGTTTVTATN